MKSLVFECPFIQVYITFLLTTQRNKLQIMDLAINTLFTNVFWLLVKQLFQPRRLEIGEFRILESRQKGFLKVEVCQCINLWIDGEKPHHIAHRFKLVFDGTKLVFRRMRGVSELYDDFDSFCEMMDRCYEVTFETNDFLPNVHANAKTLLQDSHFTSPLAIGNVMTNDISNLIIECFKTILVNSCCFGNEKSNMFKAHYTENLYIVLVHLFPSTRNIGIEYGEMITLANSIRRHFAFFERVRNDEQFDESEFSQLTNTTAVFNDKKELSERCEKLVEKANSLVETFDKKVTKVMVLTTLWRI